jgi:dipeptidyl aminopeptidase/acylaminoacyl peptidase
LASQINASNSGFGGIVSTGDSSGELQLQTAGTTAVTIDTSQRAAFVAGTAAAPAITTAGDTNTGMFFPAADTIAFSEGGAEAMRLDSSGNVGIGGTLGGARLFSKSSTSDNTTYALITQNSSSSYLFFVRSDGYTNTGTAAQSPYNQTVGSAANTYIHSDGSLQRSTSSLKYKKNVKDATHGLKEVLQIRPITYESKNELESGKVFGGLIAEEVHEVGLTEFVQYAADGTPDALAYGNMVSLLTKAIQEQQTIINDLKARVETLEAK